MLHIEGFLYNYVVEVALPWELVVASRSLRRPWAKPPLQLQSLKSCVMDNGGLLSPLVENYAVEAVTQEPYSHA